MSVTINIKHLCFSCRDVKMLKTNLTASVCSFQIFSGLLVNLPSIMDWLAWLKYFSIPRYGLAVSQNKSKFVSEVGGENVAISCSWDNLGRPLSAESVCIPPLITTHLHSGSAFSLTCFIHFDPLGADWLCCLCSGLEDQWVRGFEVLWGGRDPKHQHVGFNDQLQCEHGRPDVSRPAHCLYALW